MIVRKLTMARRKPPTAASLLLAWHSLPLLVVLGAGSVAVLMAVDLPTSVPALMAGVCIGAALRDWGIAMKAARFWPIQEELFDWPKIEALAQAMADAPSEAHTM
jgi:hypothetical protein